MSQSTAKIRRNIKDLRPDYHVVHTVDAGFGLAGRKVSHQKHGLGSVEAIIPVIN